MFKCYRHHGKHHYAPWCDLLPLINEIGEELLDYITKVKYKCLMYLGLKVEITILIIIENPETSENI